MEQLICRTCGGNLLDRGSYYECENCRSRWKSSETQGSLYAELKQAHMFRQFAKFEEAVQLYQQVITEHRGEDLSDAWWGLFLSQQQVLFEVDDHKGEWFPSFYRIKSEEDVEDSLAYNKALAAADPQKKQIYLRLGEKIAEAKKKYAHIAQTTPEYDVFICFKSTDGQGNTTPDRDLAYELYNELSGKYHVFFSEKTLVHTAGQDYEPHIYYGLYTAKVMLLMCSNNAYLESQWVKNEWSRFGTINRNGAGACIIPIFLDGYKPEMLPDALWHAQGMKESIHLIRDLDKALEAIIHPVNQLEELRKQQEQAAEQMRRDFEDRLSRVQAGKGGSASGLLRQAKIEMSRRNMDKASEILQNAIKVEPSNSEAWFLSLMVAYDSTTEEELIAKYEFLESDYFMEAIQCATQAEHKKYATLVSNTLGQLDRNLGISDYIDASTKAIQIISQADNNPIMQKYFSDLVDIHAIREAKIDECAAWYLQTYIEPYKRNRVSNLAWERNDFLNRAMREYRRLSQTVKDRLTKEKSSDLLEKWKKQVREEMSSAYQKEMIEPLEKIKSEHIKYQEECAVVEKKQRGIFAIEPALFILLSIITIAVGTIQHDKLTIACGSLGLIFSVVRLIWVVFLLESEFMFMYMMVRPIPSLVLFIMCMVAGFGHHISIANFMGFYLLVTCVGMWLFLFFFEGGMGIPRKPSKVLVEHLKKMVDQYDQYIKCATDFVESNNLELATPINKLCVEERYRSFEEFFIKDQKRKFDSYMEMLKKLEKEVEESTKKKFRIWIQGSTQTDSKADAEKGAETSNFDIWEIDFAATQKNDEE